MPSLGQHLLVDAADVPLTNLDAATVRRSLEALVEALRLTAVAPPNVHDGGAVVAGLVLIAESHVSVHAIVSERRVLADVFSCRQFDPDRAIESLRKTFQFESHTAQIIERGTP